METRFIQETIEQLLRRMAVRASFAGVSPLNEGEITKFSITTEEPHFLVGQDGKNLLALNHIIKKIVEKEALRRDGGERPTDSRPRHLNFIVDVNDVQENRIRDLRTRSQMMAERARFFKSNIELPPMNAYERMVIHSFFTNTADIATESTGSGRDRRVVIKYISNR